VLKAVTLPAMPDMKEASSAVKASPSRPAGTDQLKSSLAFLEYYGYLQRIGNHR
jgi:hypothetical protein